MSEQSKGFTVNDRRHFTADGSPRETGEEKPTAVPGSDAEAVRPSPPPASADLGSFLLSLAGQASVLLGLDAEGEKQRNVDLEGARHIISVLEMLKDKTEGRRSAEEDRLLEGLLYELRVAWVSRSRAGVA
ncbi:MAG TPA: DUF1844 domain-containing protein [Vicinamibacteria bacterium]|nr:DUF1844 domain-containing protein [Vicinamibacteria bacterium]